MNDKIIIFENSPLDQCIGAVEAVGVSLVDGIDKEDASVALSAVGKLLQIPAAVMQMFRMGASERRQFGHRLWDAICTIWEAREAYSAQHSNDSKV